MSAPWQEVVGRTESTLEVLNRRELAGLAAVLGYPVDTVGGVNQLPWPDGDVPPFAHWLNANPLVASRELGADGHPARGGFIPDIPLPRRMWAGSRVEVFGAYGVGAQIEHRKTIQSVVSKSGASGDLVFVTVLHEYFTGSETVLREEQDLVYRETPATPVLSPESKPVGEIESAFEHDWFEAVSPDPVWLFRYSAVSLNGHRIHYDRDYATRTERYPGLVVHGPLSAILLLDLYRRKNPEKRILRFECVACAPLFDTADFYLVGRQQGAGAQLIAVRCDAEVAMRVSVSAEE
jgi:3-methylfumaryl-CoA hydratase